MVFEYVEHLLRFLRFQTSLNPHGNQKQTLNRLYNGKKCLLTADNTVYSLYTLHKMSCRTPKTNQVELYGIYK